MHVPKEGIVEITSLNKDIVTLLKKLRGEAIASTIGIYHVLRRIKDRYDKFVIPQYRLGRTKFCFTIGNRKYWYEGQVEVDSIIMAGSSINTSIYIIEAKNIPITDKVFKYQLAFSMQSIAETTGKRVHGILAIKLCNRNIVFIMETGDTVPKTCIDINNLEYKNAFLYKL